MELGEERVRSTKELLDKVEGHKWEPLQTSSGVWDRARLREVGAKDGGQLSRGWLEAVPCQALDQRLSNEEFRGRMARRLGLEICEEGPGPFCFQVMARFGAHGECCMSGGDKTVNHHVVRDDVYAQAKRAHTAPQLEATGVAQLFGIQTGGDTRECPADVLLCSMAV